MNTTVPRNVRPLIEYYGASSSSILRPTLESEIHAIAEQTAREYFVSLDELRGPSRRRNLVVPRWVAMKRIYERGFSITRIGRYLNRDHTTIVHGLKKMRAEV